LGPRSFKLFDGEKADRRCELDSAAFLPELPGFEVELPELVEDLRSPMKETDSRVLLRALLVAVLALVVDCRVGRGTLDDGDALMTVCLVTVGTLFRVLEASSLSITPNSFMFDVETGEGFAELELRPLGFALARRVEKVEEAFLPDGLGIAEVRLDIRGIFVGVFSGKPDIELERSDV